MSPKSVRVKLFAWAVLAIAALSITNSETSGQLFGPGFDASDPLRHSPFDFGRNGPYGPDSPKRPRGDVTYFDDPPPTNTTPQPPYNALVFINETQSQLGFMVDNQTYTISPRNSFNAPYNASSFRVQFWNGRGVHRDVMVPGGRTAHFRQMPDGSFELFW